MEEALKKYFGYDSFRKGQKQLIEALMRGEDVLGIMPTGAGKSICFQLPAVLLPGITLVVSPLISLMKDQVRGLLQAGIPAAFFNSSLNHRQMELALSYARAGKYKIIYVAPERLLVPEFLEFASDSCISMITVDEAHCISQWGQDFRPSYTRIPDFIRSLPKRPVVSAFTATATPHVRQDIISLLELNSPQCLTTGFDRDNLYFEVQSPQNKMKALMDFLKERKEKSGIVYCATRNTTEQVCEALKALGFSAARYHAGLSDQERQKNQDDFLYDRVQIMVATNAFGMGIDKSNVSFVVHYNMPKDLESYYQEAGRAGRDGSLADCLLLYSKQDYRTNLWMIENAKSTQYQEEETEEFLKKRDKDRLREITFYCNTGDCLRRFILSYFGEQPPRRCNNCGNCNAKLQLVDITVEAQKILSCIARMKERFAESTVIEVLQGKENDLILQLGLNQLSTYGISQSSEEELHQLITYLLQNEYIAVGEEEDSPLHLTPKAASILTGSQTLERKVTQKIAEPEGEASSPAKKAAALSPADQQLYTRLSELRQSLASQQSIPAYVVFTDKTLLEMCTKRPQTRQQLLKISGVGETKLWRYGKAFLELLNQYAAQQKEAENAEAQTTEPSQQDCPPIEELAAQVTVSEEPVSISILAKNINAVFAQHGCKKVSTMQLSVWLVSLGYLQVSQQEGQRARIPTALGTEQGIERQIQTNSNGEEYHINLYSQEMQHFILNRLPSLLQEKEAPEQ